MATLLLSEIWNPPSICSGFFGLGKTLNNVSLVVDAEVDWTDPK